MKRAGCSGFYQLDNNDVEGRTKELESEIKLLSIYTNITPGWVLVGDLPLQKSEIREWRRAWNVLFWALFAWGVRRMGQEEW